jgi:O-antigen chain-terminating methyltransferase
MGAGQLGGLAGEDAHKLDAFYLTFEDQFRGTREDILERFRTYVPTLKSHCIGGAEMPVLDLGCGRGEWLEVLRQEGLCASGVDANRLMLAECRKRKLEVAEGEAVEHLRSLEAESLGGVTGFHIIEHLPFPRLIDLLDETVRVLKPGGVAVFETPNPRNVLVATERFYFDPTHRNPLPSPLVQFLAEERGLCRVEVLELHPWPDAVRVPEDGSAVAERFNQFFYGPVDYAIIGWKA